jgi:hypothetical protein
LSKFTSSLFLYISFCPEITEDPTTSGPISAELLVGIEGWRKIRKALILVGYKREHLLVFPKEPKDRMQNEHFRLSFLLLGSTAPSKHEKITQISPQT